MWGRAAKLAPLTLLAAVIAALWSFPSFAFPHPRTNDAIELSNLEVPLVGVIFLASFVGLRMAWTRHLAASGSVAVGVLMVGVGAVFLALLLAFGNLSNDRFGTLLFAPFVFAPVGAIILLVALIMPGRRPGDVRRGLTLAGLALVFLTIWGLGRGARDWLLAPYGFDILLLIGVEAVTVFLFAARRPPAALDGF
jgi:hypothetical protein